MSVYLLNAYPDREVYGTDVPNVVLLDVGLTSSSLATPLVHYSERRRKMMEMRGLGPYTLDDVHAPLEETRYTAYDTYWLMWEYTLEFELWRGRVQQGAAFLPHVTKTDFLARDDVETIPMEVPRVEIRRHTMSFTAYPYHMDLKIRSMSISIDDVDLVSSLNTVSDPAASDSFVV